MALSYHVPRELRTIGFPVGAPRYWITLATKINSLARYSKRTIQLLRAVSRNNHLVSESFHSLLRVLFNFPSLYSYAIGLSEYLGLDVNATCIPARYPTNSTHDTTTSTKIFLTGLSPCFVCFFKQLQIFWLGLKGSQHHISTALLQRFSLPYAVFGRSY